MGDKFKFGKGTVKYPDGSVYSGKIFSEKKTGEATLTFANGDTYKGQFLDDKKHGNGKLTKADGTISYEGKWWFDKH